MDPSAKYNIIWKSLLELKERSADHGSLPGIIAFKMDEPEVHFDEYPQWTGMHCLVITDGSETPEGSNRLVFKASDFKDLHLVSNDTGDDGIKDFLQLYVPVVLSSFRAKSLKRTISFSHFAQSLDGKISTVTGKSRWISCQENLEHSHRMRALCDGIIIGANTLQRDFPSLNVRHVEGPDPVKIIIGNTPENFDSVLKNYARVMLITSSEQEKHSDIHHLVIPGKKGIINPSKILSRLFEEGIRTVYMEGGAYTTSGFLSKGTIDYLQLYIAPRLFGSGVSSFALPSIDDVSESTTFDSYYFIKMGDGILFTGEPTENPV